MYQLPLKFIRVSPQVSICATRVVAMISTEALQARNIIKEEKKKGTFINGAGSDRTKSIVILDNGTVIGSSYKIPRLLKSIEKANNTPDKTEKLRETKKIKVYDVEESEPEISTDIFEEFTEEDEEEVIEEEEDEEEEEEETDADN